MSHIENRAKQLWHMTFLEYAFDNWSLIIHHENNKGTNILFLLKTSSYRFIYKLKCENLNAIANHSYMTYNAMSITYCIKMSHKNRECQL